MRRAGQQIYYALNTTVFQDMMATLLEIFSGDAEPAAAPESGEGAEP